MQISDFLFIFSMATLGLIIGSFLNVVIYRLPIILKQAWEKDCLEYMQQVITSKRQLISLLSPRSHCPHCKKTILWRHNIPILSYILLDGKCHHCKANIHWRYPIVEAISFFATLVGIMQFGVSWETVELSILTWALIALAFIDWEYQLLPDGITLPLIWLGLLVNTQSLFTTPENAIIGAISGYLFLWLIAYLFKIVRKVDGIGHGDFKLFAAFGAWLGWSLLPVILLVSSFVGSIVGLILIIRKKHNYTNPMPFGPYLIGAGWLAFFFGKIILSYYLQLFV